MLPWMIPLQRRLDLDEDVSLFSVYTRLEGCVAVAALGPVDGGAGRATVDGAPLKGWEAMPLRGLTLIFLPLARANLAYGGRCRVRLEGFRAPGGRRYAPCAFTVTAKPRRGADPAFAEHDAEALRAAREGMVLLRNEGGALPLAPEETLNCLGAAQHYWRASAAGASRINPRVRPGFHQAVAEHSRFRVNEALAAHYRRPGADDVLPDGALLAAARERSDAALVFIGRHSGEMLDTRDVPGEYRLTPGELAMLRAAREGFARVIVILNTSGPVEMAWLKDIPVDAILFTGFAGMLSAHALVELLDGRFSPSGHLPDTWPWRFSDDPVSRNFPALSAEGPRNHEDALGVRVYYEEDVYLGYRYYDTFGVPVAFPFGHGLSYTRFELTPGPLQRRADGAALRVAVRNVGPAAGMAVAQLYLSPPRGRLERPARLLAAFDKTGTLAPGESQELELFCRWADVAAFDEARGRWLLEAGEYGFWLGQSLGDCARCASLRLEETPLGKAARVGAPAETFKRLTRADPTVDGRRSGIVPLGQQFAVPVPPARPVVPGGRRGRRLPWRRVLEDPARLDDFVAGLSLGELVRLNVCAGHRWLPWQSGAAGVSHPLRRAGVPAFCVSDANPGLNLKRPNVGFPAGSVIAASFDRRLAETVGRVVAAECPGHGVDLVLAPAMNLHRGPLGGRHAEYFSEDPVLTGELAGCHGRGLEEGGVGCCYKHLFCNNAEVGRLGSHSVLSEQALRELYLRPFAIAFRVRRPTAVMTSYNAVNGLYPAENPALLIDLLRGEWGFRGFAMSDWGSTRTVSAVGMVRAGVSWITPGGFLWTWRVLRAARRGEITRAELERNARWLLGAMRDGLGSGGRERKRELGMGE